ncbi:MAG: sulfite exporter TauE/SafE family protein, partial [Patescibacteria group bacterium]
TSIRKIIGSDIVHATILLFTAGIAHLFVGNVDWNLVCYLLIGSIPGVIIGSKLSARAPKKIIKSVLIILLIFFGIRTILY